MVWLGIALIILAVALIVGELFTGSGLLFIAGIVSLIFGIVVLFTQESIYLEINWWLVAPLMIIIIGLIVFIIFRIRHTYLHKATTGKEDLVGRTVIVTQTLDPEGTVFDQGEIWNAVSKSGKIERGEKVIIEKVDGLTLYVVRPSKS